MGAALHSVPEPSGKRAAGKIVIIPVEGRVPFLSGGTGLFRGSPVIPKPYYPTIRDLPESYPRRVLNSFLNLVYPEECLICPRRPWRATRTAGSVLRLLGQGACAENSPSPLCLLRTALPEFRRGSGASCAANCILKMPPYSGARSFGYYTAGLAKIAQELKFHGKKKPGQTYGPASDGCLF